MDSQFLDVFIVRLDAFLEITLYIHICAGIQHSVSGIGIDIEGATVSGLSFA